MKSTKVLLSGFLAILALAGQASAQTKIYIAGAPAARKVWNIAISNVLASVSTGSPTITTAYTGASFNAANQVTWTGGNIGGTPVTIKASWVGSTAGIQAVAQNPAESIAALKVKFLIDGLSGANQLDPTAGTNPNELAYPQFTLSDTLQNSVPFHGRVTRTSPVTNYVTLDEASATPPAITAYKFLTNNGSPARLNNITSKQAQALFTGVGYLPLAFFTGLNSDESTLVYALGRDIGSGARYVLLAESGIGTANSDSLTQYTANLTGTAITSYSLSAGGTKNLITFGVGNGGYASFSPVQTALAATSTNAIGYFITYVTDTDAPTAIAAGAHELAWNGASYGTTFEGAHNTAPTSISEGQYTYWSYLRLHYQKSFVQATYPLAYSFANSLVADLATDTTTGAILTSDVIVSRTTDGGLVTGQYY